MANIKRPWRDRLHSGCLKLSVWLQRVMPERWKERWRERASKRPDLPPARKLRVAVFIDDLDRCLPGKYKVLSRAMPGLQPPSDARLPPSDPTSYPTHCRQGCRCSAGDQPGACQQRADGRFWAGECCAERGMSVNKVGGKRLPLRSQIVPDDALNWCTGQNGRAQSAPGSVQGQRRPQIRAASEHLPREDHPRCDLLPLRPQPVKPGTTHPRHPLQWPSHSGTRLTTPSAHF